MVIAVKKSIVVFQNFSKLVNALRSLHVIFDISFQEAEYAEGEMCCEQTFA
jgi:hypothetical protein